MKNHELTPQHHNQPKDESTADSATCQTPEVISGLRPKLENAMLSVTPLTLLSATSDKANSDPSAIIEYLNKLKDVNWWEPLLLGAAITTAYFASNQLLPKKWEKYSLPGSIGVGALAILIANGMGSDGKTILGVMIAFAVAIGVTVLVAKKGGLSISNFNPFSGDNAGSQDALSEGTDTNIQLLPCEPCNTNTIGEAFCDVCGTPRNTENDGNNPPPPPDNPDAGISDLPPNPTIFNSDPFK